MEIYFNTKHRKILLTVLFEKSPGHNLFYQENISNLDSPKPWSLKVSLRATLKHFPYLQDLNLAMV